MHIMTRRILSRFPTIWEYPTPIPGATFSEDLSWKIHNERSAGKVYATIRFHPTIWMLPERTGMHHLIRSGQTVGLEYTSITNPCRSGEIQRLEKVQRPRARFVKNKPGTQFNPDEELVSITDLVEDLKWQSLKERWKLSRNTNMWTRISSLQMSLYLRFCITTEIRLHGNLITYNILQKYAENRWIQLKWNSI